jgi:hypothetical protein
MIPLTTRVAIGTLCTEVTSSSLSNTDGASCPHTFMLHHSSRGYAAALERLSFTPLIQGPARDCGGDRGPSVVGALAACTVDG